jgi:hypothetical protein
LQLIKIETFKTKNMKHYVVCHQLFLSIKRSTAYIKQDYTRNLKIRDRVIRISAFLLKFK